jgi:hypothetical protein
MLFIYCTGKLLTKSCGAIEHDTWPGTNQPYSTIHLWRYRQRHSNIVWQARLKRRINSFVERFCTKTKKRTMKPVIRTLYQYERKDNTKLKEDNEKEDNETSDTHAISIWKKRQYKTEQMFHDTAFHITDRTQRFWTLPLATGIARFLISVASFWRWQHVQLASTSCASPAPVKMGTVFYLEIVTNWKEMSLIILAGNFDSTQCVKLLMSNVIHFGCFEISFRKHFIPQKLFVFAISTSESEERYNLLKWHGSKIFSWSFIPPSFHLPSYLWIRVLRTHSLQAVPRDLSSQSWFESYEL